MRRSLARAVTAQQPAQQQRTRKASGRPENMVRGTVDRNAQRGGLRLAQRRPSCNGGTVEPCLETLQAGQPQAQPENWQQHQRRQQYLLFAPGQGAVDGEVTGNGVHCDQGVVNPGSMLPPLSSMTGVVRFLTTPRSGSLSG